MLRSISVEKINEVAELAKRARDAQDLLLNKMQIEDQNEDAELIGEEVDEFDSLDSSANNGPLRRLRDDIEALTPEARRELIAVMLIGRGEFAAADWEAALDQAASQPQGNDTARLADKVRLHDFLKKGLYQLKLSEAPEAATR